MTQVQQSPPPIPAQPASFVPAAPQVAAPSPAGAAATTSGRPLARTGHDQAVFVAIAALAIVAGAWLLHAQRLVDAGWQPRK